MKTQVSYFLLLCFSLFLTSVNAADTKSPAKAPAKATFKPVARISCAGVQPFFYGFTYFTGQRVVYNGSLYQATRTNSGQYPLGSSAWAWFGPCN